VVLRGGDDSAGEDDLHLAAAQRGRGPAQGAREVQQGGGREQGQARHQGG